MFPKQDIAPSHSISQKTGSSLQDKKTNGKILSMSDISEIINRLDRMEKKHDKHEEHSHAFELLNEKRMTVSETKISVLEASRESQGKRIGELERKDHVSVLQTIKSLGGWIVAAALALLYGRKIPFFGG